MVAEAPKKPFLIFNTYLGSGPGWDVHNYSNKTQTFKGTAFSKRVISFGSVDRSISYPPGELQVSDAEIHLQDKDNDIRDLFDDITPLRRQGEIIFDFEDTDPGDPIVGPLFKGEITNTKFPTIEAKIHLKDSTSLWLNRRIPRLLTRDRDPITTLPYWPNLPTVTESSFAPIIMGRVESLDKTNLVKQGVIVCPHVDTVTNDYCLARHKCFNVFGVYRREKLNAIFRLVNPAEYTIEEVAKTIYGRSYTFTMIRFIAKQKDGTVIHADASGINWRWNFETGALVEDVEVRNVADHVVNLLYYMLQDETAIENFDIPSFVNTWHVIDAFGWLSDGAVTEDDNQGERQGITTGEVITQLTGNFLLDFFKTNYGLISLRFYQPTDTLPGWSPDVDYSPYYSVNWEDAWYMALQESGPNVGVAVEPGVAGSEPYWQLLYGSIAIPITADDTLRRTIEASTPPPDKIFNTFRVRFHRQNAGLTDYYSSASAGQFTQDFTLTNIADALELEGSGQQPILEQELEYHFIRDEQTALEVTKKRAGYHTLRSYPCEFEVAAPAVVRYLQLAMPVSITHKAGIAAGDGWVDQILKIYQVVFDLETFRAKIACVRVVDVPDASFTWSETTDAYTLETRIPPHPVLVNDAVLAIDPESEPQTDFNDWWPPPPTLVSEMVDVDLIYNIISTVPPPPETVPSDQVIVSNVHWQVDNTTNPRKVSAYVAFPSSLIVGLGGSDVRMFAGTLDGTDERPTTLDDDDIYKAIFYSTDFDHLYFWVGTSEFGTVSGWRCIEQTAGNVCFRPFAPAQPGFRLCDGNGVTTCRISDYKGDVSDFIVPNLVDDTFIKGSATYTGPNPTAAVAPTTSSVSSAGSHSHAGSTVSSHSHTVGGNTGNGGGHTHTSSLIMSVDSAGAHSHGEFTGGGGTHNHGGGGNVSIPNHSHGYSFTTSSDGSHSHSISGSVGVSGTVTGCDTFSEAPPEVGLPSSIAACGGGISANGTITGGGTSGDGSHNHTGEGTTTSDGADTVPFIILTQPSHLHGIDAEPAHSHGLTTTDNTIFAVADHNHSLPANTGNASPAVSVAADGSHTHTVTINANGVPKSMGLTPYLRT